MQRPNRAAAGGKRSKRRPDRLVRVAERLNEMDEAVASVVRPIVESALSGAPTLPLGDVQSFAHRSSLRVPAARSRRDALADIVENLLRLSVEERARLIPDLEDSLAPGERSLEGWDRIKSGVERNQISGRTSHIGSVSRTLESPRTAGTAAAKPPFRRSRRLDLSTFVSATARRPRLTPTAGGPCGCGMPTRERAARRTRLQQAPSWPGADCAPRGTAPSLVDGRLTRERGSPGAATPSPSTACLRGSRTGGRGTSRWASAHAATPGALPPVGGVSKRADRSGQAPPQRIKRAGFGFRNIVNHRLRLLRHRVVTWHLTPRIRGRSRRCAS